MEIVNRKAKFNYFIEEQLECGIELLGSEIKSIRLGKTSIEDAYVRIKDNELYVINMFISKYDEASYLNHDERRERKLLAHKNEIKSLLKQVVLDGKTLIPLKMYLVRGKVKVLVGVCKGKKLYDKRQVIKERDLERKG